MVIVVITGKATRKSGETETGFIVQTIKTLALQHPENKFILAGQFDIIDEKTMPVNVEYAQIKPGLFGRITGNRKEKIPASFLRKVHADRLIYFFPNEFWDNDMPCFFLVAGEAKLTPHGRYANKSFGFLTPSHKKRFLDQKGTNEQFCSVINLAPDGRYDSSTDSEKNRYKDRYTAGRDYYLVYASSLSTPQFIDLLKAFSLFKKRQKSSMKLLFSARLAENGQDTLKQYRYREDILFLNSPDELPAATAAAYAVIIPPFGGAESLVYAYSAMKAQAPLLAAAGSAIEELAPGAVSAYPTWAIDHLGAALIQIYTNETLRADLLAEGKKISAQLSWEQTAASIWRGLPDMVG
jgi:hypothetical protein